MEIIRGKIQAAQKIVIYGPEGIGKSTFASQFPEPLFIDTEGGTKQLDVARFPRPTSWQYLLDEVREVIKKPDLCRTLVLDTADWAEQLCTEAVCAKYQKSGIEDFGYGKGYVFLEEEFGRLLNLLGEVIEKSVHVVVIAHAKLSKFEQPDELASYDRWSLKLTKKHSPMLKEWADMVLFANYKIIAVKSSETKKAKAQGGTRIMYTSHHPCWDAKNRFGLPDELPFSYKEIEAYIPTLERTNTAPAVSQEPAPSKKIEKADAFPGQKTEQPAEEILKEPAPSKTETCPAAPPPAKDPEWDGIPKALSDLMESNNVSPDEIRQAVYKQGYFPFDMPIREYPPDFIEGILIGAWPQVYAKIFEDRDVPF